MSRWAGDAAAQVLVWSVVLLLLVLPALLGSASSVFAVLLALLLTPLLLWSGGWREVAGPPALLIFPAVLAALVAAYAVTARDPGNVVYATSFLGLAFAGPVHFAARRWSVDNPALCLAAFCLAGTLICALVALSDVYLQNLPRASGYMMGGNLLARIALVLAFTGLAGLFLTRSRWRLAFYLGPVAALLVLALTGTRGAALAIPPYLLVLAVCLWVDRRDRWQLLMLGALAAGLLALLALSGRFASILVVAGEFMQSGTIGSDGASAQRLEMLHTAFEAFKAAPWLGYGWANLAPAAAQFIDMSVYGGDRDPHFQFHNDLANFAVAAGMVGILCWLALLAAPIVGALQTSRDALFRPRLYCCLQLSGGYLALGLTDLNFGYDLPTTLYAFLTALVLGAIRPGAKSAAGPLVRKRSEMLQRLP
jgi:O-antigen ligase